LRLNRAAMAALAGALGLLGLQTLLVSQILLPRALHRTERLLENLEGRTQEAQQDIETLQSRLWLSNHRLSMLEDDLGRLERALERP